MVIECSHCKTRYKYDEDRFEAKPSKKIRCARCKKVFEIANPAYVKSEKPSPALVEQTSTVVRTDPSWLEEQASDGPAAQTAPIEQPLVLPPGKRISVAIIEGPEAAKVFRVEQPEATLGRTNTDIVLNDSESSREHARIEVRGNFVFLRDLDSRNGTWVDGERIEEPVEIHNQTEFQIGGTTLMLIVTDGE